MNEPRLEAALAGSWNQVQRRLQIEPASLTCATMGIQASNLILAAPDNGPLELTGTLKYQADAARIRQWFADPGKRSPWQLAGQLHGTAELHHAAGMLRGELSTELSNLAVVDASGQQFQEPRIQLLARANYEQQARAVQLEQLELTSGTLTANVTGRTAPVERRQQRGPQRANQLRPGTPGRAVAAMAGAGRPHHRARLVAGLVSRTVHPGRRSGRRRAELGFGRRVWAATWDAAS